MIRYTQIITVPQDEPCLKKFRKAFAEENGWTVSETTVVTTFERTDFYDIEDGETE